ncbi:hypothetical protein cypCar_00037795 [Cyprinus carpio]|nr:hypothetical protein cypCar_00037795 [Cyprinus carpio]
MGFGNSIAKIVIRPNLRCLLWVFCAGSGTRPLARRREGLCIFMLVLCTTHASDVPPVWGAEMNTSSATYSAAVKKCLGLHRTEILHRKHGFGGLCPVLLGTLCVGPPPFTLLRADLFTPYYYCLHHPHTIGFGRLWGGSSEKEDLRRKTPLCGL